MRTRLSPTERRTRILEKARELVLERGLSGTEMEDIRLACDISRGGLYHHFGNKRAVLDALIKDEVAQLAEALEGSDGSPIPVLLRAGSGHLGSEPGVISGMRTREERLDYLSGLELAMTEVLSDLLRDRLEGFVQPGADPGHVAELFLTINTHINRREILGQWTSAEAAGFAATALQALAPLLKAPADLDQIISELNDKALQS
ncbi:MAG: TetR/AcrR family transcriptional regulator [Rhodobacteraceae bacterium]|nr:TetR/AcrR family transcriptional regulator [Paracoccaceae bacterium]